MAVIRQIIINCKKRLYALKQLSVIYNICDSIYLTYSNSTYTTRCSFYKNLQKNIIQCQIFIYRPSNYATKCPCNLLNLSSEYSKRQFSDSLLCGCLQIIIHATYQRHVSKLVKIYYNQFHGYIITSSITRSVVTAIKGSDKTFKSYVIVKSIFLKLNKYRTLKRITF